MTPSKRRPLTPPERHARSRDVLIRRTFGAIAGGRSLTAIARRRNMPRVRTFRRWLAADPRLRQSYDTALMVQTHVMLDDMVAAADRYARGVRGRRRIAAVKRQIEARKLWIATIAMTSETPGAEPAAPGVSDAAIAMLEAAHARPPENAPSSPPPHPISRRSGARSPSPPGGGEGRGEGDTALETKPEPAPVGEDTQAPDKAPPNDPPPNSWYPRWFNDDDLREPPHEHDWDPFEW